MLTSSRLLEFLIIWLALLSTLACSKLEKACDESLEATRDLMDDLKVVLLQNSLRLEPSSRAADMSADGMSEVAGNATLSGVTQQNPTASGSTFGRVACLVAGAVILVVCCIFILRCLTGMQKLAQEIGDCLCFVDRGRVADDWRGLSRWQYNITMVLDSSWAKRLVVWMIILYTLVGLFALLFDNGFMCLSPRIKTIWTSRDPQPDLRCMEPYSTEWIRISVILNDMCFSISFLLLLEHTCRVTSVSPLHYCRNKWLLLDFAAVCSCCIGDALILWVLRPKLLETWKSSPQTHEKIAIVIVFLRALRLALCYRVFRFVRNEWNPASEIAKTVEVLEMLRSDMPNIDIQAVQVIRNQRTELRAYNDRLQVMRDLREVRGDVQEKLLFFGTQKHPPHEIVSNPAGLDSKYSRDGELGTALYGSERPSYSDCYSYADLEADPTGHTRQLLIYQALIGEAQDVGHETSESRRYPDLGFDSVSGGPWEPSYYRPEDFGLDHRDIHSTLHALYEPRGQSLLIACITYTNLDAFEEIDKLMAAGATNWWDYHENSKAPFILDPKQKDAADKLAEAIEQRDLELHAQALHACKDANVPKKTLAAVELEKKQNSESAGISLTYLLSDEFKERAQGATGKVDPTFMDMKEPFFEVGDSRIGANRLCPRDLKRGCSFLDTLSKHSRKKATHFLSWVWRYSLSALCSALKCWLEQSGADPDDVFLWICFFCNNQWRILVDSAASGSDNLEVIFQSRLTSIGKMIAVMDAWEDPLYTKRIWTIYEQYVAAVLGIKMTFALPEGPASTLREQLELGGNGIMKVIRAISHVDAENAKATMLQDELKVKDTIRNSIGFNRVNEQVKGSISKWASKQFKKQIDKMVHEFESSVDEAK